MMLSARAVRINTDGLAVPAKTPGRDLRGRPENAPAIATTLRRRGKNVTGTTFLPLGDKTPRPNRPETLVRKHLKLPRNSTQKNFETPMNHGRHWDISDGDIDVSNALPVPREKENVEDNLGSDEIEYCAPNTLDLPYQPPFDFELPDYAEVGMKIRDLAFSFPFDDVPGPPEPEFLVNQLESNTWETFSLPPLASDDPFTLARLESNFQKVSTTKPFQKTGLVSHRRVQSSLARLGSARSGLPNRPKPTVLAANSKTAINPGPLRKQPPKPASDVSISKAVTTTTVKSTPIQKKTTAAPVQRARATQGGQIRSQVRPHTSLSLPSKNKALTLASKSNNSSNLQILDHQVVDEDFVFDV